ncbi:MAG: carboxypeptidase-like regulatory domain-containing protein, partial [Chitinophagaceae bacterium]|nr:carboxypeptidase-like regulatory domain-containing protein [Chitinophagaceae bacterium]
MLKFVLSATILLISGALFSQSRFTLNGYIKDSLSGESVINATISVTTSPEVDNSKTKAVLSNQYGFFSITLDPGEYRIDISHISYSSRSFTVNLQSDLSLNFSIINKAAELQEVIIYNKKRDGNVKNAQMGKIDLSMNQIRNIPAFMGEVDLLKAIQLLPGVQSAGEGNAGFYVRGGGPDQNLIILDDAVVYNTGHLFGFFSIFNGDAIKNVSLIKGGMP